MATNVKNIKRVFSLITSLTLILSILLIPIQNADKVSAYVSYSVTYKAGDYSDITGNSEVTFTGRLEGGVFDLPDPKRFSRLGHEITGWYCEHDGNIYKPYGQYKMPNQNVTFTAVWKASTYNISFTSNNSNRDTIYVTGTVGEYISMPECIFTYNGYEFAGWTYGGEVYQSGESFLVPGVMSGLALSIKATWIKASETTTTETTTTETTTTETTTTETTTAETTTAETTTSIEYTTTEFTTTEFTSTEHTTNPTVTNQRNLCLIQFLTIR